MNTSPARGMDLSRGWILVPTRYADNPITSKFVRMFRRVEESCGCKVIVADDIDPAVAARECSWVMAFKPTQWNRPASFTSILKLPPSVKVFGLWDDIHQGENGLKWWTSDYRMLTKFFKRCDGIFCTYRYAFERWYPKYASRLIHLPHFFSEDDFTGIAVNDNPLMKCILSGAVGKFYPLRNHALKNPDVVVLKHPGYSTESLKNESAKFGGDFARELSKYFCGVTCSLTIDYSVAKYMEIPAAGCLLLASHTPDLDYMGYRDEENYLAVDVKNFDAKLKDVLSNPGKYEGIRRAGYEFARSRLSDVQRAKELEEAVRKVLLKTP